MGVICSFLVFSFVFCVPLFPILAATGFTICNFEGCNCTVKFDRKYINCSFHEKTVDFSNSLIIPSDTSELYIYGGEKVILSTKTFNALQALTFFQIRGTRKILMEKKCFLNITSSSLLIQIHNCDELTIKTGAFEYVQSSVSIEISNVQHVAVEQQAFSMFYSCTFFEINNLSLFERSFDFKHHSAIARHGPATILSFDKVVIPIVPKEVFLKPLSEIKFHNSNIGDIQNDAFKATEISSIIISNTTLGTIEGGAFADGTLLSVLKIMKSKITSIKTKAIMAGISNLTITHSTIQEIETDAVNSAAARVEFIGNEITNFQSLGFVFNNWNNIIINDNTIRHIHTNFIEANPHADAKEFSFKGNDIYNIEPGGLNFLLNVTEQILIFDDNVFHKRCDCNMSAWLETITSGRGSKISISTSYCLVDELLSNCTSLPAGIISIKNFTAKVCPNFTICETVENNLINTTSKTLIPETYNVKSTWLIGVIAAVGVILISLIAILFFLCLRSKSWLKDKCFPGNVQYNNDLVIEEEATIVTLDNNEKLQIPEELTLEFLQVLAKHLDDPVTHQEASEMIERLYETFIVDDSYENNNRDEEEAHLYEELGNLSLQIPPPPYEEAKDQTSRSILKLMEEKININGEEQIPHNVRPALVNEYSEPNDAAVHLYSEIKNKNSKHDSSNSIGSDGHSVRFTSEPGPSTKF